MEVTGGFRPFFGGGGKDTWKHGHLTALWSSSPAACERLGGCEVVTGVRGKPEIGLPVEAVAATVEDLSV